MRIAFISCHDYGKFSIGYHDEETHLLSFLQQKGLCVTREVWNDRSINWRQYDLITIKSPWDYHEQIDDFHTWLEKMQSLNIRMLNPAATIKWNSDKHYLGDIARAGMKVIPTEYWERGTTPELLPIFERLQTEKIIIKPCVSAGARNVRVLMREEIHAQRDAIYQSIEGESHLVQPFMKEIFEGEWSFVFFNGMYSHCILNKPGEGDFRVQHYHGGSTHTAEANNQHVESARAYVQEFAPGSLYARVDGIIRDGQFYLMELELTEPFLYLESSSNAYENYYSALLQLMKPVAAIAG